VILFILLPAAAKKKILKGIFSNAVVNRGDGGVSPTPSLLFRCLAQTSGRPPSGSV
jgi:hypothetical protein